VPTARHEAVACTDQLLCHRCRLSARLRSRRDNTGSELLNRLQPFRLPASQSWGEQRHDEDEKTDEDARCCKD
jgi:hypothetical protein